MEEVITISQRQSYLHLSASSLRKSAPEVPPFVGVIIAQVSTANAIGSLFLGLRWMSWWRRTKVATNGDQYHIPGHHGAACHRLKGIWCKGQHSNRRIATGKLGLIFVMDGAYILSLVMEEDGPVLPLKFRKIDFCLSHTMDTWTG